MDANTKEIVASNLVIAVINILENHTGFDPTKHDIGDLDKKGTITSTIHNVIHVYNKTKDWIDASEM